jgi:hypothetical protein
MIYVRGTSEASPSSAPVLATQITSTTFSIEHVHSDFSDSTLEFGPGDRVRCKLIRLGGPGESEGRQRMVAVECTLEQLGYSLKLILVSCSSQASGPFPGIFASLSAFG